MCENCIQNQKRYVQKSLTKKCSECQSIGIQLMFIIIELILVTMFLIYFAQKLLLTKNSRKKNVLKIMIRYIHFLILSKTYNINVPDYYDRYNYYLSKISQIGTFWISLNCFASNFSRNDIFLISSILRLLTFFSIILSCFVYCRLSKKTKILINLIKIIFFITIPVYFPIFYSNIVCITIENKKYLKINKEFECYSLKSFFFFTFIMIFLLFSIWMFYRMKNTNKGKLLFGLEINWKRIEFLLKILLGLVNESNFNEIKKFLIVLVIIFYYFFLSIIIYSKKKIENKFKFFINSIFFLLITLSFYCYIWVIQETYGNSSSKIIVFSLHLILNFGIIILILKGNSMSNKKVIFLF